MKYVQIGILAALLLVAGLLYKIYQAQGQPPAAQPVAAVPAQTTPAPAVAAPTPAPSGQMAVEARPEHKPTPAGKAKRHEAPPSDPAPRETASAAPPPVESMPQAAPAPEPPAAPAQPAHEAIMKPSGEAPPPPPREPHKATIPAGTVLSVRLLETLSSAKNQTGDTFTGTLDQPVVIDGFAIAEKGARVEGKIVEAVQAGRVKGVAGLTLALTRLHTSDGQVVNIDTQSFHKEGPTSKGDDLKKVGAGAALGAVIGAIAGGGKGAAIGAGVGGAAGGGAAAATRGKPAELPVETRLSFRLENPITLTEQLK